MSFISVSLAVVLIYPRMTAVHNLLSEEADGSLTTLIILLTASACVLETRRHAQRNNIQSKQSI